MTEPETEIAKQIYPRIGEFICTFSQLEEMLRLTLAEVIRLPKEELLEPVTASYDFSTLCNVVVAAYRLRYAAADLKKAAIFEKLISRCRRLNDDRVRIVHGTWWVLGARP